MAVPGITLNIGQVILLPRQWNGEVHEKFHILIDVEPPPQGWCSAILINSEISGFVANRPELVSQQVLVTPAELPFLKHDSYIACHDYFDTSTSSIIGHLNKQKNRLIGSLNVQVAQKIIAATQGSTTLDVISKQLIANKLANIK